MPGSKRQEQAAATQQQLLESARTVFTERGFQGTSVAAITDAANTAHGTFYLYFRNKEDVFIQLMASAMEEFYRYTLDELDPPSHSYTPGPARDRVALFLRTAVEHGALWRALLEAILVSPAIRDQWQSMRVGFQRGVAERMRAYQDLGELRDMDVELATSLLVGMIEWHVFTSSAFEHPAALTADDRTIDAITDLWVSALDVGGTAHAEHRAGTA